MKFKKYKLFTFILGALFTISIAASLWIANTHLHKIDDEHNHSLNCPIAEFLCVTNISFAVIGLVLIKIGYILFKIFFKKKSYQEIHFQYISQRAPPVLI